MILKYMVNKSERFIDNITGFCINEKDNPIKATRVNVRIEKANEAYDLELTDSAYLMNDVGRTIERII